MTPSIENQIEAIMRKNGLRHISAVIQDDNSFRIKLYRISRISYYQRHRERIREYARNYYHRNRERIRKKQHEYYLRRKSAKRKPLISIPTPAHLARAISKSYNMKGLRTRPEDFMDMAVQVMNLFGFEREIASNQLEHEDIAVLYALEDLGLARARTEEVTLPDSKPWRINSFILNYERIHELSQANGEPEAAADVYSNLPEEAWVR